jgi:hypothetical protein
MKKSNNDYTARGKRIHEKNSNMFIFCIVLHVRKSWSTKFWLAIFLEDQRASHHTEEVLLL